MSPVSLRGGPSQSQTIGYTQSSLGQQVDDLAGILGSNLPPKEEAATRSWLRALQLEVRCT